jgi:hypothetical protein
MSQRSMRDATLKIKDGASEEVEVKIGDGNISWNERRNVEYTHNRGAIDEVRLGDDEAIEVSFDFIWEWISSITGVAIVEAIKCTAAGWVTSGGACEPDAVDLELTLAPTNCGSDSETVTFTEFRWESINPDLRSGQISCTGRCMSVTAE